MAKRKLKGVADATRASLSQVEVVESAERELYAHVRAYIASARKRSMPSPIRRWSKPTGTSDAKLSKSRAEVAGPHTATG